MSDSRGSGAAAADARRLAFPSRLPTESIHLPAMVCHRVFENMFSDLRAGSSPPLNFPLTSKRAENGISVQLCARPELPRDIRFQLSRLRAQTRDRAPAAVQQKEMC